jgi:hypothetical protein
MAVNFPGPYQLRLRYNVNSSPGGQLDHVMSLNVDPQGDPPVGTLMSSIPLVSRNTSTMYADEVIDTWIAYTGTWFNRNATSFYAAELWRYEPGTFNATWITEYLPQADWINTVGVREASQLIFSFRTAEGGIMYIHALDTMIDQGVPSSYNDLSQDQKDVVDWLLDPDTCFFLGRDTSYPVSFRKSQVGINEAVFKARYR